MQRVELSPVPPTASPPSLRKAVATTPARSQFSAKDPSAGLIPPAAAANRAKKPTAAPPLTRTPSNASAKADSRQPQQTPLRTSPPAVVATAAGVKVGSPSVNGRGGGGNTASPASPRRNLTGAAVASPGLAKKAAGSGAPGKAAPPPSNPGPTKPAYTSTPKARVTPVAGTPSAVAGADSDLLHDATRSGVNNNTAASMHNGDHNGISSLSDVTPPPMSSLVEDVPSRQVFVESEALAFVSPSSGSLGSSVESVVSSTSEQQVSLEEREDALLIVEEEEQLVSSGQRQQRRSSSRHSLVSSGGERKISEKTTLVELVTTETTEDETDFRQKTREIQQEIPLVEGRKSSMTNGGSNYWATQALNNANTASIYQVYNKKVQKTVFSHRECQTFIAQFWGLRLLWIFGCFFFLLRGFLLFADMYLFYSN